MKTANTPAMTTVVTNVATTTVISDAVTVVMALSVPDSLFNTDGIAVPIVHGIRFDGRWHVSVLDGPSERSTFLGRIVIGGLSDPDRVLEAAFAWAENQCTASGLKIVRTVSDRRRLSPREQPHLVLGRILVVGKDWS